MKNSHKNQEFRFFLTRTDHTKQTCWLVNSLNSLKKELKHETTFTTKAKLAKSNRLNLKSHV